VIAVVTDSAASLPRELATELGIEVVPLYVRFGDEVHRDGEGGLDFYARLRGGETAGTAAPAPGDFLAAFERTGADQIVCVTVASSVSGAHVAASVAAGELKGGRVEVVDSLNASMGQGFVAMEAARAVARGASLGEAAARARDVAERVRLVATIDTFDFLRRSGRVGSLAAFAGSRLSIKPVFALARGEIGPVARPRTRARALERVAAEAVSFAAGRPVHLAAVHADAEPEARALLQRIESEVEVVESLIAEFTPAMGAHTGPGVVGVASFSD